MLKISKLGQKIQKLAVQKVESTLSDFAKMYWTILSGMVAILMQHQI
jgi:hypothetical protein